MGSGEEPPLAVVAASGSLPHDQASFGSNASPAFAATSATAADGGTGWSAFGTHARMSHHNPGDLPRTFMNPAMQPHHARMRDASLHSPLATRHGVPSTQAGVPMTSLWPRLQVQPPHFGAPRAPSQYATHAHANSRSYAACSGTTLTAMTPSLDALVSQNTSDHHARTNPNPPAHAPPIASMTVFHPSAVSSVRSAHALASDHASVCQQALTSNLSVLAVMLTGDEHALQ